MALITTPRRQFVNLCRHFRPSARPLNTSAKRLNTTDFFATTPIFYVNADPHIGHLHSTLLADVYTRWNALAHPETRAVMCTGTDEHGLKIQRVAESQQVEPQALCDRVSERFRDLTRAANVDASVFIRTTEPRHRIAVEHVWRELEKRGYIYKSSYAGWYAVSDEAYYAPAQVAETVDPTSGEKYMASIETGTRVEWMEEDNYKFKLSAFRERLIEWLSSTPNPVQPPSRTTALLASISHPSSTDLADLSISRPRSRLTWGIPVPSDPDHTIYVWIDALVNYLTVSGYPWLGTDNKLWPPNLQVVGKDIIRFHALYLPAVLLALDLPLPNHILTHGHWTMDRFKMSKSRGNVANPFEAMSQWSPDAIRMFLMLRGGNSSTDADYSELEIEKFYKKDLAGQMGNLLQRITGKRMIQKLGDETLLSISPYQFEPEDQELIRLLQELPDTFSNHLANFEIHRALGSVFDALSAANRHIQLLSPWLATATSTEIHRSLYLSSETLRIAGILLQPFMPHKSRQLLQALGVREQDRTFKMAKFGQGTERDPVRVVKGGLWPAVVVGSTEKV
ncbi:methionine--tRNA ligase MSM1 [Sporobolomyces koalae]|uniref:methionine--tRNA ligase MSM1 n=1 Tax=Sporobolomyces koalae TaxID=500713 RepID=UPI00317A4A07